MAVGYITPKNKEDIEVHPNSKDDSSVVINIKFKGDNNSIVVNKNTYEAYNNPRVIGAAKEFMDPLGTEGYDSISFRNAETGEDEYRIEKSDLPKEGEEELPILTEDIVKLVVNTHRTTLSIRVAVYQGERRWEFAFKKIIILANMDDYNWLSDFQSAKEIEALPGSSLEVSLEETSKVDKSGKVLSKPTYRITKVYRVIPPPHQTNLNIPEQYI